MNISSDEAYTILKALLGQERKLTERLESTFGALRLSIEESIEKCQILISKIQTEYGWED